MLMFRQNFSVPLEVELAKSVGPSANSCLIGPFPFGEILI
jgi:hypothetical protein